MIIGSINVFNGGGFAGISHRIESICASGGAVRWRPGCGDGLSSIACATSILYGSSGEHGRCCRPAPGLSLQASARYGTKASLGWWMMQGEAPDMGNSPSRVLSALYPGMPSADCFGIRLTAMPPSIDDLEKDVARCANLLRAASHIALAQAVVVHAQGHTHVRAGEPFRA